MANVYSLVLTNPGAEAGDMTGWTNSNMQANTGAAPFGGVGISRPANSGSYFFKGLYNTAAANAYQDIAITNDVANTDIDANVCVAFFSWSQNSYSTGNDNGRVEIEFLNASDVSLNVTRSSNSSYTSWTRRNLNDTRVPVNTRKVRVRMVSIRASGTDNDGYFDDFSDIIIVAGGANGDVNVATVYTDAVTPTPNSLYSNVATVYTDIVTPTPNSLYSNVTLVYTDAVASLPEDRANIYQLYVEVISDISNTPLWKNKTISTTVG